MSDAPPAPAPVSLVSREPSASVKALIKRLEERVAAGDVRGLVVLIACPGKEFARIDGGEFEIGTIMHAFEDWKWAEMKRTE